MDKIRGNWHFCLDGYIDVDTTANFVCRSQTNSERTLLPCTPPTRTYRQVVHVYELVLHRQHRKDAIVQYASVAKQQIAWEQALVGNLPQG